MSESEIEKSIELEITEEDSAKYKRLDKFLAERLTDYSRTFIKNLFLNGLIFDHEEKSLELKKLPPVGTKVIINIPPPIDTNLKAENIPLEILYEDEHLIIVNKKAGMVTHPAPGHYTGTLVNAILGHCPDLQGIGNEKRPGIVHRLDKGTSGVMVVAKNQQTHEKLVVLFSKHDIKRQYECLCINSPKTHSGRLESSIGRDPRNRKKMAANVKGKNAITHYEILNRYNNLTHLKLELETGRTHQIRVHLASLLNCPILCDPDYGRPKEHIKKLSGEAFEIAKDYPYPFLHARLLGFIHPITHKDLIFECEPPNEFKKLLQDLDNA